MAEALRVLLVDDSADESLLVLDTLRRDGYDPVCERVDTAEGLQAALDRGEWDIVLSDFAMPAFDGMAAFQQVQACGRDIPFIFVSGRIGEGAAVEAMRRGAADYVLKDNLTRLGPAIGRELREAQVRKERIRAERQLHESQRLLQAVFDALPVTLAVKDAESRYRMANRAWCERYGVEPADVLGKHTLEIPGRPEAEKRNSLVEDQNTLAAGGRPQIFEGWDTTGKQELRHYQSIKAPILNDRGMATGLIAATIDNTEHKRAEEQLRESEARLALIYDSMSEPIALAEAGADGRFRWISVNTAFAKYTGLSRQQAEGGYVDELLPRDLSGPICDRYRRAIESKARIREEQVAMLADGPHIMMANVNPVLDGQGRCSRVVTTFLDITSLRRAGEELESSQHLLRTVFDTIPHAVFMKDLSGRYLMVNRAWCERYRCAPEAAIGALTVNVPGRPEADKRRAAEEDRQVMFGDQRPLSFEGIDMTADGQAMHFQSLKTPLKNAAGAITGLVGVVVDTTGIKRAEEELRANQRLLQTVFDTIPHHLIVKDLDGCYLMVNRAWCDTFGKTPEEVLHRPTSNQSERPPEEIARIQEEDRLVFSGTAVTTPMQSSLTVKSGEKRYFKGIKAPLRNEAGATMGLVAVSVDVTAEIQAQHKADTAHARLFDAIESLPAAFYLYDPQERLVLWNTRAGEFYPEMFAKLRPGILFEEVIRAAAEDDIAIAHAEGTVDEWVKARLDQFRNRPGTFEQKLKDGRWIQGIDRRTADGSTVALRFDVTEVKQREAELRQSQKLEAIGSLAGGIAHDFNNLLTVICSYADFIRDAVDAGPLREDAQIIRQTGDRAAALTRQLLAFSRRQVLRMRPLDLNESVSTIDKMLQRLIGEHIVLRTSLQPTLGLIQADQTQVEQIILNLAVNARDAMPKGGALTIETANQRLDAGYASTHAEVTPGDYVLLAVTDTGHGMDPETRKRIFEPFFTTKPLGQGTGMGLATVYGIVKQMQGHIFVDSEPGKGTCFNVYFPRSAELEPPASISSERAAATSGTETVLLVEDEELVRRSAERILTGAGYSVLAAANVDDALAICDRNGGGIDLLLTDVVMPGLSGPELWNRVQEVRPMRAVFMSGYTDDSVVRHGILEGNLPFLHKPFTRASLLAKVREVLDAPPRSTSAPG